MFTLPLWFIKFFITTASNYVQVNFLPSSYELVFEHHYSPPLVSLRNSWSAPLAVGSIIRASAVRIIPTHRTLLDPYYKLLTLKTQGQRKFVALLRNSPTLTYSGNLHKLVLKQQLQHQVSCEVSQALYGISSMITFPSLIPHIMYALPTRFSSRFFYYNCFELNSR